MFAFLLGFQYFCIFVVLGAIWNVLNSKNSYNQNILMMIFASNLINMLGTVMSMQASSLDGTLTGIKIAFYGKIWSIFFIYYFTYLYCGLELGVLLSSILSVANFIVLGCVFTCEHHSFFYKTIEYATDGIIPYLKTTPGPVDYLYFVLLLFYMFSILGICLYKYQKTKDKDERRRIACLLLVPVIIIASFALLQSGITGGYDSTSVAVMINTLIIVYAMRKLDLIDYVALAKEELVDEFSDGVLVLNARKEVEYSNKQAQFLFPEIKENQTEKLVNLLEDYYDDNRELWISDKLYAIRKKELINKDAVISTIYTLTDNTQNFILTYIDALTEVKNRRALLKDSEDEQFPVNSWYVFMDIDNFKGINDTKGHQVGDECLCDFASALVDIFPRQYVYRYGGDEFVVVVDLKEEELLSRLKSLNDVLSDSGRENPFMVSGGYVKLANKAESQALMKKADDALYEVKNSGKGRFAKAE